MPVPETTNFYLTERMLREQDACIVQRTLFKEVFGRGKVFLTLDNFTRAVRAGMALSWLSYRVDWILRDTIDKETPFKFKWLPPDAHSRTVKIHYNKLVKVVTALATARAESPPKSHLDE